MRARHGTIRVRRHRDRIRRGAAGLADALRQIAFRDCLELIPFLNGQGTVTRLDYQTLGIF
ncbi:hypothetical protein, partial [Xenorhabdus bovienii]|uniref:hypothetical protein n=1 Tax=Xenorhabdus bovienii TaxID=40576 RepID=UPI003DA48A9C